MIYRHAYASIFKPLNAVHHSARRFMTADIYRTHNCTVYEKVAWSSLSEVCDLAYMLV